MRDGQRARDGHEGDVHEVVARIDPRYLLSLDLLVLGERQFVSHHEHPPHRNRHQVATRPPSARYVLQAAASCSTIRSPKPCSAASDGLAAIAGRPQDPASVTVMVTSPSPASTVTVTTPPGRPERV